MFSSYATIFINPVITANEALDILQKFIFDNRYKYPWFLKKKPIPLGQPVPLNIYHNDPDFQKIGALRFQPSIDRIYVQIIPLNPPRKYSIPLVPFFLFSFVQFLLTNIPTHITNATVSLRPSS